MISETKQRNFILLNLYSPYIKTFLNKHILIYLVKFFTIFCIAYFGTLAVEGVAAPGNYYWPFVDHYFNYPSWLRASLLHGTRFFLSLSGYETVITDPASLQMLNGKAVHVSYDCYGVGVMSFWLAFVVANKGNGLKKSLWVVGGFLAIWLINITRIGMLLVAINKNSQLPFNMDNHDFFTVLAYGAIFLLMFLYDRSFGKSVKHLQEGG